MNKSSTVNARIKELREYFRFSQAEFANLLGVGQTMVSKYESRATPDIETLRKMVSSVGLKPAGRYINWLISGENIFEKTGELATLAEMITFNTRAETESQPPHSSAEKSLSLEREEFVYVPQFNVSAAAGGGSHVEKEEIIDCLAFRKSWFHKMGLHEGSAAIISIVGDSMEPQLRPNDLVLLNTNQGGFVGDGIYAVQWGGELYVKRLQRIAGGALRMVSENTSYEPVIIPQSEMDTVKVIGRVVWVGRQI